MHWMSTLSSQIAKFVGPTWGPPGSCWPQMGPMLTPWTLLSGLYCVTCLHPLRQKSYFFCVTLILPMTTRQSRWRPIHCIGRKYSKAGKRHCQCNRRLSCQRHGKCLTTSGNFFTGHTGEEYKECGHSIHASYELVSTVVFRAYQ